ncbi:MAG: hypothetical protein ABSD74_11895 [Rhizomicrobium sp.]|jgi:hypothetical protein
MSRPRYAPITSNLLVRKGEAVPWQMHGAEIANTAPPVERRAGATESRHFFDDAPLSGAGDFDSWKRPQAAALPLCEDTVAEDLHDADAAPHHESGERTKRCTFRLTPAEHERLGIVGVKRNLTRQQLLRAAIEHYLDDAKSEFRKTCGCLSGGPCHGDC